MRILTVFLGNDLFVMIKGQIIFRDEKGQPVITHIDDNKNDYTEEHYNQLPENAPFN